ncbi:PQQ-dependent sugar dehydrogenase [Winogradskyella sp.]|uniref:PQQ-dependent sugar dehydrogenase n=1 Tax=Winogradskyella sp. TaxID=1883156 RepID=UPI002610A5D2|nr:PQQ-dependent sugar dehydrogenase [Winogradskyella sp.]
MKGIISKKPIGSIISCFIPKSFRIRIALVAISSVLLFSYLPYFSGSGLPSPKSIGPYVNNMLPVGADFDLDATYREAFPNLEFFYPITYKNIPSRNKVIIGQLNGIIFWFEDDETTTTKNTLLDLSGEVGLVSDGGFLGLTVHPDFDAPTNPKNYFYVYYATKNGLGQDSPPFGGYTNQGCDFSENEYEGNFLILERFEVDPTTMSFVANSRTIIMKNRMYGTTHYGGGLDFGDDGFLYLTTGDQASWQRSQDIAGNLSGGLLRIDVDKDPTKSHPPVRVKPTDAGHSDEITGVEYWIPNDNPFCDSTPGSTTNLYGQLNLTTPNPTDVYQSGDFFEEYYAIGLRNPFRMTKDSSTGEFYIGDVGLNTHEEVNIVSAGANFGWPLFEGNIAGPGCYTDLFNEMPHTGPLVAFSPTDANSITGGFVYRGSAIPELYGQYICSDYGSGDEIFAVDVTTGDYHEIATFLPQDIISFGEDDEGELFLLRLGFSTKIYKLIDNDPNYDDPPQLLSQTGIFSDLTTLDVVDGFVPYELYESFWSDGALKKRWIAVPNNDGVHSGVDEQIDYSEYEDWEFPSGTVIVKHFDLRVDDNDPNVTRKVETRVSVVDENGELYYLTYNWNESETDAVLQISTVNEVVDIATVGGGTRTQTWHYPSNSECIACHNTANKGALGLKTRYLNTDYTYAETGLTANQLVTMSHLGMIDATITDADTPDIITNKALDDPNATLNEKARSYMDLNCAYCHRHDTDNRADFDLRYYNNLEATELLTSGILSPLGIDPNEEIVYVGDASKSILFHRMNSVDPAIMMPPLSKTIIDQPAVDLIEQWINQLDANSINEENGPNPIINLALLPSAQLSSSVPQGSGRGELLDVLYDPSLGDYKESSNFAEYGVPFQQNLGTVDADNGFYYRVDWPNPQFLNYITIGGAFPNQPQPNTQWRVSYLRDGNWIVLDEGTGGWIENGIFEWDGTNEAPKYAEAVRVQLFSDGVNDLVSIHIRGRGGTSRYGGDDTAAEPKATLMQFLPYNAETKIDNIVAGTQSTCDPSDNTYTQELIITYSNAPETGSLLVNGQNFPIITSPQTITLTGLESNGMDVQVTAEFTDGYKSLYESNASVFTAPSECDNIVVGVDENMVINGDHTVSPTGSIEIMEGGSLTINGNLTINGEVTLNSVSSKYSSLIVTGTTTGTIKYKRHVNEFNGSTGNDLIASPLKNQTFGSFATDNPNIFENPSNTNQKLFGPFNETTSSYEIYDISVNGALPLTSGIGYRAARDSSEDGTHGTTFTFTGEIEAGIVNTSLTTAGSSFEGWNLIGNPYTAYLDFDSFFSQNSAQLDLNSYQAIYGYDGNASDGWTVLNNATTGRLIAPGQGFFVKSKSGGGMVTFNPNMRVTGNSDDFIVGRPSNSSPHHGHIKLVINSDVSFYATDVYFNENATLGLDPGYDAAIFNGNAPDFALYSLLVEDITGGLPFAIQALAETALGNVVIPLGINASQGQQITLSIAETDLPSSINVYLEDTLNNTFTLLNDNNHQFILDSDISGDGRFYLRFEGSSLSISESPIDQLEIFTNQSDKTIVINGQLPHATDFKLYDITGKLIISNSLDITSIRQVIDVNSVVTGVYILELNNSANQKRIEKLIIK